MDHDGSPLDPDREAQRLEALRSYGVRGTEPDEALDRLVRLAARLTHTPVSLVTIVAEDTQFFKARVGLEVQETPRTHSVCAHAIRTSAPFVVRDLARDRRFQHFPLVAGEPHMRFYAGVPLEVAGGHRLGTLCVMDTRPRTLDDDDLFHLSTLAGLVVEELERVREPNGLQARVERLERELTRTRGVLDSLTSGFFAVDADWRVTHMNLAAEPLLERRRDVLIGQNLWDAFPEAVGSEFERQYRGAMERGVTQRFEAFFPPLDTWFEVRAFPLADGLSVYFDDVTERRDFERQRIQHATDLSASEAAFRALADRSPDIVVRVGRDLRVRYVNRAVEEATGLPRERLMGLHAAAADRSNGHRPGLVAELAEVIDTGRSRRVHVVYPGVSGGPRSYEALLVPERTPDGAVVSVLLTGRDVTAQARARAEIEQSERRYRALAMASASLVWRMSADGHSRLDLLGGPRLAEARPHLTAENWQTVVHPDDRARVAEAWAEIVRQGTAGELVYRVVREGEPLRWYHVRTVPVIGPEGQIEEWLGANIDITERKTAEARLLESEARFRALVQNSSEVVTLLSSDGTVLYQSPSSRRLLGLDPNAVEGHRFVDFVHPEDAAAIEALIASFRAGATETRLEIRVRVGSGVWRWLEAGAANLLDDPHVEAIVLNSRDVTERIERADALERSESRYHTLSTLVKTFAFAYLVPEDGSLPVIEWATGSVEDVIGWPAEDLLGRPWGGLQDDPMAMERLASLLAGTRRTDEVRVIGKDGRAHWVRFHMWPEADAESGRIVRIHAGGIDVTPHREAKAALVHAREQSDRARVAAEQARARAEEMARLKDAFLANMSHEIRTPLTAILGFSELLREEVTEHGREFVEVIEGAGRRLSETLASVLELSQIQSADIHLQMAPLNVSDRLREAAALFRTQAQSAGLELCIDVPEAPLEATLDKAALDRILSNLVGNAIKYTQQGTVTLHAHAVGPWLEIAISDTGIGIGEDYLPHLFEEFRQESSGLSRTYEGVGLGLAICSQLTDLMGGTIAVESRKGVGSTFTVRLPRHREASAPDIALSPAPPALSSRRVLVVEDVDETRMLLEMLLGDVHEATFAATPEEALEAAGPFDVVLLDINLGTGRMDGIELLQRLREKDACQGAHFVAVTAYALPGDGDRFLAAGFDRYVSKPFDPLDLLQSIDA